MKSNYTMGQVQLSKIGYYYRTGDYKASSSYGSWYKYTAINDEYSASSCSVSSSQKYQFKLSYDGNNTSSGFDTHGVLFNDSKILVTNPMAINPSYYFGGNGFENTPFTVNGARYQPRTLSMLSGGNDLNLIKSLSVSDKKLVFGENYNKYVFSFDYDLFAWGTPTIPKVSGNIEGYYNIYTGDFSTSVSGDVSPIYMYVILEPYDPAPTIEFTEVNDVLLTPAYVGVKSPVSAVATVYADGVNVKTVQLVANEYVDLGLSSFWSTLESYQSHTITVKTESNGYACEDRFTFTKKDSGLSVSGVSAPVDKKPIACTVLSITDNAEGEDASFYVANNANDENVAWEKYTGGSHYFSNEKKTDAKWAVNWKYEVDASQATGSVQPAIKGKVAMGVIYDEVN